MSIGKRIVEQDQRHVWHPFTQELTAPPPVAIERGEGASLIDYDGKRYLDMISSWWVNLHGHANPIVADAIAKQAHKMEQVIFAGFTHQPASDIATRICDVLPDGLERVFFSDNGSTAVEVALKMAYQSWLNRGETQRTRFLCFEGGYHGDTFGAMAVGQSSGFFTPFDDLLFKVDSLPYPHTWDGDETVEEKEAASLKALDAYLEKHGNETAAFILEPIVQGASGMRMARYDYLREVVRRLQDAGVLVIFDEIMTGFGRLGKTFACLELGVTPDIICLSKGLTAGFLPLSLTICHEAVYKTFLDESWDKALVHSHSFTANPLGCAAALASLDLTLSDNCTQQRLRINQQHRQGLNDVMNIKGVQHTRLQGTIAAFDLVSKSDGYTSPVGPALKKTFTERGLLIRPLGNVMYLLPPYCTTEAELNHVWQQVAEAVEDVLKVHGA